MKILVLSLLRLGDAIMLATALRDLRRQYPKARIDILVNKEFSNLVKPFLTNVDQVISFDRKSLQSMIGNPQESILAPYDELKMLISGLNDQDYDLAFNLTQTHLSGMLFSAIKAKKRVGLEALASDRSQFNSPWLKYLNDLSEGGADRVFHYIDIYRYVIGHMIKEKCEFEETDRGREEIAAWLSSVGYTTGPKIILQISTSDEKKNWPVSKWIHAAKTLLLSRPDARIIILGAPSESIVIDSCVVQFKQEGINAIPALLSLEGAFSLLQISDLLVTGDTSIKHLASFSRIAILELALGSSDRRKTGAYKQDALIIHSKIECAPCRHSHPCSQKSFLCQESIDANLVGMSMNALMKRDWQTLRILADEYGDHATLERVHLPEHEYFLLESLRTNESMLSLHDLVDRSAWRFYFSQEHLQPLAKFGSAGVEIKRKIEEIWQQHSPSQVRLQIEELEKRVAEFEFNINEIMVELTHQNKNSSGDQLYPIVSSDFCERIKKIEKQIGWGHSLSEKLKFDDARGIYNHRQLQSAIHQAFQQNQIKLKLLRSVKSALMESI